MADIITLSCPTCGGRLQITGDIDRFACAHCGNEHLVRRGGGIVALVPVVEGLRQIQRGTDRAALEMAIRRLMDEIRDEERKVARLATELCDRDFQLSAGILRGAGKISFWKSMRVKPESDREMIRQGIENLSLQESEKVCALFEKWGRSRKRKQREVASLVDGMKTLKQDMEDKRSKIDQYKKRIQGEMS